MSNRLVIGSKVLYKKHEGVVCDVTYLGLIGVKFNKRWRWDLPESKISYYFDPELKKIKPKFIRIFNALDPYGEEKWEQD